MPRLRRRNDPLARAGFNFVAVGVLLLSPTVQAGPVAVGSLAFVPGFKHHPVHFEREGRRLEWTAALELLRSDPAAGQLADRGEWLTAQGTTVVQAGGWGCVAGIATAGGALAWNVATARPPSGALITAAALFILGFATEMIGLAIHARGDTVLGRAVDLFNNDSAARLRAELNSPRAFP